MWIFVEIINIPSSFKTYMERNCQIFLFSLILIISPLSGCLEETSETIEPDGNIIQQDYPSWEKVATISSMRDSAIFFADFTAEGEMIATFTNSGAYSVIEFWNTTDQTRITEISPESRIHGGALSPTENNMVTYGSGMMQVWNLENFTLERTIQIEEDIENCMKFSDDGAFLITAHDDWIISVWNTTDYSRVSSFDYGGQIYDADISPENDFLAVGGYKRDVKVWNLDTSELEATLDQPEAWVVGIDFSPNGVYLASSSSSLGLGGASELFVWETSDWLVHSSIVDQENRVFGLEFSPDSKFLSTTWDSRAAFFYDVGTNDLVQTLPIGPFGFGGGVNEGDILHNVFENQILVIDEGGINIQILVRLD